MSISINMGSDSNDYDWQSFITELELYCEERGWTVEFSKDKNDEAYLEENHIILCKRHKPEILYYLFIHEIGHLLMVNDDPNYYKKYKILSERSPSSQTYRVCRVEEEIEAWNVGKELIESFGLPINVSKFEELKASMISSYMLWANHRKHPHEYFNRPRTIFRVCEDQEQSNEK